MADRTDRRIRDLARSARAEVEAALDIDAELVAAEQADAASIPLARDVPDRSRAGWLAAAAAVVIALTAGFWFVGGDDDSIEVASTPTSGSTEPTPTEVAASPATTSVTTPATVPPSTSPTTPAPTSSVATTEPTMSTVTPTTEPAPATTEPAATTAPRPDPEVPVVEWRELRWEAASLDRSCSSGASGCTQLVYDADGVPLTYDPSTRELTRHDNPAVTATLPAAYGGGYVVHAGSHDVVYLVVDPATPEELAADVVAVTLADGDAGREIGRWADVTNNVGDSELVATEAGLVNVNCCGPDTVRPASDAEVLVPWLDRNGDAVTLDAPTFRVEVDYPTLVVHRDDPITRTTRTWTYEPAGEWMPRGMPFLTATFDGGFLATEYSGPVYSIARGYSDGSLEQIVVDDVLYVSAVDPAGRFEIADVAELDGRFARVDPFPDDESGPVVDAEIDVSGTGAIELPGLDEVIDGGVTWSANPVEFAAAVSGAPQVNEVRSIDATQWTEDEWTVEVTTSNLFDDSVEAVRRVLVLERGDDGVFEFRSGQWSQSCQAGRGHQEFSTEYCV